MSRPRTYHTIDEWVLTTMLNHCIDEETQTIPHYIVRMRMGSRIKSRALSQILTKHNIIQHTRADQWKGHYYDPKQVADALLLVQQETNRIIKQATAVVDSGHSKPW